MWYTEYGEEIEPGETIAIQTRVVNQNIFDVKVYLSIRENYTLVPDGDDFIVFRPSLNGTWESKINETYFILPRLEAKNISIIIKSPNNATTGEVYGLYLSMYVETLYIAEINENDTYACTAHVINGTVNNNTISHNNKNINNESDYKNNENDNFPEPVQSVKNDDDIIKSDGYYPFLYFIFIIFIVIISIFISRLIIKKRY
jgi:hypothetical protein